MYVVSMSRSGKYHLDIMPIDPTVHLSISLAAIIVCNRNGIIRKFIEKLSHARFHADGAAAAPWWSNEC